MKRYFKELQRKDRVLLSPFLRVFKYVRCKKDGGIWNVKNPLFYKESEIKEDDEILPKMTKCILGDILKE